MDCNPPGSSVHGILQARILEWVAMPFSRDLPNPGIEPRSPTLPADSLPSEPPGNRLKHVPSIVNLPPLQPVTEYWVENPASCSKFPLDICSKHGKAYVSMLLSQLSNLSCRVCKSVLCLRLCCYLSSLNRLMIAEVSLNLAGDLGMFFLGCASII